MQQNHPAAAVSRRAVLRVAGLLAAATFPTRLLADDYPSRVVKFVVPFPPALNSRVRGPPIPPATWRMASSSGGMFTTRYHRCDRGLPGLPSTIPVGGRYWSVG